jgi:hypothetical protein
VIDAETCSRTCAGRPKIGRSVRNSLTSANGVFRGLLSTGLEQVRTVPHRSAQLVVCAGQTVPHRWEQVLPRLRRTVPLSLSIGEGTGPSPADAKKYRNQEKIRRTEYLASVCREASRDG